MRGFIRTLDPKREVTIIEVSGKDWFIMAEHYAEHFYDIDRPYLESTNYEVIERHNNTLIRYFD